MDRMFVKYKEDFVAAMRSTLDMMYNSKDLFDIKANKKGVIDEQKYKEILDNIKVLEQTLSNYQKNNDLTPDEQNIALAALGTTVVHLEYLASCYSEAAEKAKVIIANVKNGT